MTCDACGHDWWDHTDTFAFTDTLCEVCYREPYGGPCFPWEFR